jgi:transposase
VDDEVTSVLFGLDGFVPLHAFEDGDTGELVVTVETVTPVVACPDCGGLKTSSRGRRRVRLRDSPHGGRRVTVLWSKRQRRCDDGDCERRTFVEQHPAVGRRRRSTARCRRWVGRQVGAECRAVTAVAAEVGMGWRAANSIYLAETHAAELCDPDRPVSWLGVDETAARRGRRFVTNLVDLGGPGGRPRAHDVLVGRSHQVLADWLAARPETWRAGVNVVALDPYAPFRSAVREQLPHAVIVVDKFHGIRLFNTALDAVRRRLSQQTLGRRGRKTDPAWRARHRLLRANERLADRGAARVVDAFDADVTGQLEYAYWVKEMARWFWSSPDPETARRRYECLVQALADCDIPELHTLGRTLDAWAPQIHAYFTVAATNGPTEGLNRKVKQVKRVGCGFTNMANYRVRILGHCNNLGRPLPSTPVGATPT